MSYTRTAESQVYGVFLKPPEVNKYVFNNLLKQYKGKPVYNVPKKPSVNVDAYYKILEELTDIIVILEVINEHILNNLPKFGLTKQNEKYVYTVGGLKFDYSISQLVLQANRSISKVANSYNNELKRNTKYLSLSQKRNLGQSANNLLSYASKINGYGIVPLLNMLEKCQLLASQILSDLQVAKNIEPRVTPQKKFTEMTLAQYESTDNQASEEAPEEAPEEETEQPDEGDEELNPEQYIERERPFHVSDTNRQLARELAQKYMQGSGLHRQRRPLQFYTREYRMNPTKRYA
jgi:hypothetical protein